jgi:hypothetical protein
VARACWGVACACSGFSVWRRPRLDLIQPWAFPRQQIHGWPLSARAIKRGTLGLRPRPRYKGACLRGFFSILWGRRAVNAAGSRPPTRARTLTDPLQQSLYGSKR